MKERSLIERVVAILGVLIGTVVWVARLLISLLRDAVGKVTQSGGATTGADEGSGAGLAGSAKTFATDLRTRGESLVDDVAAKSQAVVGDAREKVDELLHREGAAESEPAARREADGSITPFPMTESVTPGLSSTQHEDVGGIPEAAEMESMTGTGSTLDEDEDDGYHTRPLENDEVEVSDGGFTRGIPNLEEPGGDSSLYGSESGSLLEDEEPVADYAGQPMSESDIGLDRGDDDAALAEGEDILRESRYDGGLAADELASAFEDEDELTVDTGDIPAASRGWQESGDESLTDDEVAWISDQIDIENDEADTESASGMHIVGSPDEPFIDDDAAAQSLGFTEPGTEPPFDVTTGDETVVDDDVFAADALGNRIGGDAASGDLGPSQSPDDATWAPGSSVPDSDVQAAYDGSGVDTFASDEIAEDMLKDVEQTGGDEGGTDTSSVAWASTAGVIDEDLTRPTALTGDEDSGMSAGDAEARTDAGDAPGEPGSGEEVYDDFSVDGSESDAVQAPVYNPDDAGLLDVAAEMAEDLDQETGARGVSRSGAESGMDTTAGITTTGAGTASGTSRSGGRRAGNAPAGAVRGDATGMCPADYPIKGNASSHIYHRPTDSSYDSTIPEFCFATEEHAKAAGFRPRKG